MNILKTPCIFLLVTLFIFSCSKEKPLKEINPFTSLPTEIIFNVTDQKNTISRSGIIEPEKTILGIKRTNPFEIGIVLHAQNNLYQNPIININANFLYVKFTPSSLADIQTLENTDLEYYDFPLEYEVITLGDYYQEPIEGTYPILYAVVHNNFVFPTVPYEIIDNLYLKSKDPLLITECFRLTDNLSRLEEYLPANTGYTITDIGTDAAGKVPATPNCPPGCTPVLINNNPGGSPSWEWFCDCSPPPPGPTNACGCELSPHARHPGGCVQVEDTQLGFQGLKRVKVIIKDTWFTQDTRWTNDKGCWQIYEEYKGKAWIWVKFKNNRCRIRGTQNSFKATWQWIVTVKDYVGKLSGPYFNNISIKYNMWTNKGSAAHIYWGAATVNNAVHEAHVYMNIDGINTPPDGLDIYVGRNNKYGYALMGAQNYLAGLAAANFYASTFYLGPFAALGSALSGIALIIYMPKVYVGINYPNSDQLKSLAYHELAHTSHYDQVGLGYWIGLVNESVIAGGHGDQHTADRNKLELCESWAEYLGGVTYTHRTYGSNHSFPVNSFSNWHDYIEHTWNESPNHIPIGLHHDLLDIGEPVVSYNSLPPWATTNSINDNISGVSISSMFQAMNSQTKSIQDYQDYIRQNSLGANSINDLNNLFNSY